MGRGGEVCCSLLKFLLSPDSNLLVLSLTDVSQQDANEAFDWGHDEKLTDDPNDIFTDPYMRGSNPWPSKLPGFEEHLSTYYRTLRTFCRVLARNVALSLNLDEGHFDSVLTHPGCSALVAHYPPQEKKKGGAVGLSAHTDAECKTYTSPCLA